MADPVVIVDYDPEWPRQFERLRGPVAGALGGLASGVLHTGSTAVPGLAAKPIIDMIAVLASPAGLPAAVAGLAALGYVHQGDKGVPGREAFRWPPAEPRHHLYVCAPGARELRRQIAFRDYLRAHAETARAYTRLKRELAARFRDDRAAYTDGKAAFVEDVLALAGWRE